MKKKSVSLSIALVALLSVGLYAVTLPAPAAHAAPGAHSATVTHMFGPSATASFVGEYTDPASGDTIAVELTVNISTQSMHMPPSKPTSGPTVGASIIERNTVTGEQLNGAGQAPAPPGMTIDGQHLTSAYLPEAQVEIGPTGDNPGAFAPYVAVVGPVSWTGEGRISVNTQHLHFQDPELGITVTATMMGKSRMATAEIALLSYHSPLTHTDVTLTSLTNASGPSTSLPTELDNGRSTLVIVSHNVQ